ncbi:MAG: hypothetical protein Q7T31_14185 [Dietzia sp.]|uniref:hypothetical protein n=1 Tax=unclassified Dietzia TaxID=2617939 RepID=UPI0015FCDF4F|nr:MULTISPECIES: hypothetical protein [unclassified Dietzia]MBB1050235.1 hypothetical protein [Dietzia sp. CW19]MBC7295044.1 hypothetical protein [Dietzia sp.]MDO8395522.1 hypothetical protein [Dietzia sp.]MDZ4233419.1 hypothetical protein [Dietzia sp.]
MTTAACSPTDVDHDRDHDAPVPQPADPDVHQHEWLTRSSHRTSEGTVTYESCHCGAHRVLRAGVPVARV